MTDKQRKFAHLLARSLDPAGSYLRVYKVKSRDVARKAAWRLLTNVDVRNLVSDHMDKLCQGADLTAEKVLKDVERVRIWSECSGDFRAALKASELQGKYLKMWPERIQLTGKDEGPVIMQEVTTRDAKDIPPALHTQTDTGPEKP